MFENSPAHGEEGWYIQVVFGIVDAPATDFEVSRAEAVPDVVDRWQQGEVVFVGPAALCRVGVIVGA